MPASPELSLIPERFEVLESEVALGGGYLQYQLSLSARPTSSVKVTISPDISNSACYGYDAKFELEQDEYDFHPDTSSDPQNVTIIVNRLNSAYEGAFSASFKHAISTEDEDFKSAFLRPVTVSLQDDSVCADNARQYEDGHARKCGCMEGFRINETDPLFCDSATSCVACPEGMECAFQQNHTLAIVEKGYYRINTASLKVVKCPGPSTQCIGNTTSGDKLCALGHEGAFCMVCKLEIDERYVKSGDKCVLCDGGSVATMYALLGVFGLLCIAAVGFIARSKEMGGGGNSKSWFSTQGIEAFYERFTVKYKILVTFFQILSKIGTLYPIQLPALFTSFLGNLTFLNFDISILPMNCLVDSNFHSRLVATTLLPVIFVFMIMVSWLLLRQRLISKKSDDFSMALSTLTAKAIRLCVIFLFTIFPMVSTTIFQVSLRRFSQLQQRNLQLMQLRTYIPLVLNVPSSHYHYTTFINAATTMATVTYNVTSSTSSAALPLPIPSPVQHRHAPSFPTLSPSSLLPSPSSA